MNNGPRWQPNHQRYPSSTRVSVSSSSSSTTSSGSGGGVPQLTVDQLNALLPQSSYQTAATGEKRTNNNGVGRVIHLRFLPPGVNYREIIQLLGRFGKIVNTEIGAGQAFVEMDNVTNAEAILNSTSPLEIRNTRVQAERSSRVQLPPRPTPANVPGHNSGGGGGGESTSTPSSHHRTPSSTPSNVLPNQTTQRWSTRCYRCGRFGHTQPNCPGVLAAAVAANQPGTSSIARSAPSATAAAAAVAAATPNVHHHLPNGSSSTINPSLNNTTTSSSISVPPPPPSILTANVPSGTVVSGEVLQHKLKQLSKYYSSILEEQQRTIQQMQSQLIEKSGLAHQLSAQVKDLELKLSASTEALKRHRQAATGTSSSISAHPKKRALAGLDQVASSSPASQNDGQSKKQRLMTPLDRFKLRSRTEEEPVSAENDDTTSSSSATTRRRRQRRQEKTTRRRTKSSKEKQRKSSRRSRRRRSLSSSSSSGSDYSSSESDDNHSSSSSSSYSSSESDDSSSDPDMILESGDAEYGSARGLLTTAGRATRKSRTTTTSRKTTRGRGRGRGGRGSRTSSTTSRRRSTTEKTTTTSSRGRGRGGRRGRRKSNNTSTTATTTSSGSTTNSGDEGTTRSRRGSSKTMQGSDEEANVIIPPVRAPSVFLKKWPDILDDMKAEVPSDLGSVKNYEPATSEIYGEIEPHFFSDVMHLVGLKPNMVFWDIGSGIGNLCLQAAAEVGCRAVGIEIRADLHHIAEAMLKDFNQKIDQGLLPATAKNKVQYINADVTDADVALAYDADVVFINNWRFTPSVNLHLLDKFRCCLPDGAVVVALKELFPRHRLDSRRKSKQADLFEYPWKTYQSPPDPVSWDSRRINYHVYTVKR